MLVLSRKAGESVRIGGTIEVIVLKLEGRRVRLGIEAPQDIRITRNEQQQLPDVSLDEPRSNESLNVDLVGDSFLVDQEMGSGI